MRGNRINRDIKHEIYFLNDKIFNKVFNSISILSLKQKISHKITNKINRIKWDVIGLINKGNLYDL